MRHNLTEARSLSAKETAKIIRGAIHKAFPHVAFSVRMDSKGTSYGSIRIRWTDGPTTKMVEAIVSKYEGKGFDGMIDLQYHIDGWMLNGEIVGTRCLGTLGSRGTVPAHGLIAPHDDCELVHFGAGYISCSRELSEGFRARCAEVAAQKFGITPTPTDRDANSLYVQNAGEWFSTLVHRESVRRAVLASA